MAHGLRIRLLSCGLVIAAMLPALAAAEWGIDAQTGAQFDDNVSNSLEADERKADTALNAGVVAGWHEQLSSGTGLSLSAIGDSNSYLRYSGLSNLGFGARAQLRQKFGLGAQAPWASVSARALHYDYHDDDRDGWQYDAGVAVGKRLGDRWSISASARYDRYQADRLQAAVLPGFSTAAYDIGGWTLGVQAGFLWTEADALSLSYSRRNGTVTAVTEPDLEVLEYSDAVARDTVFGGPPRVAYRLRAKTDSVFLTWSHAFSGRWSANLSYGYRRSFSDEEEVGAYYSNLVGINVVFSY